MLLLVGHGGLSMISHTSISAARVVLRLLRTGRAQRRACSNFKGASSHDDDHEMWDCSVRLARVHLLIHDQ